MKLLALLIGMVLILEGLPYVAAPESMKKWLQKLSTMTPAQLRSIGLIGMVIGFVICWIVMNSGYSL